MFFLVVAKNPECNKHMSYTYHRNTAVTTQIQQGNTFLVLEKATVRQIHVLYHNGIGLQSSKNLPE